MSYATELAKLTRKKITVVQIDLEYCDLTWGVSPCTPVSGGSECYNTYRTCNDYDVINEIYKVNYDPTVKTYSFSNVELPAPVNGYRPYLKSCNFLPQEIKDNITVKNRLSIELIDDHNESDIDNDPYWTARSHSSIQVTGSYFKRLFARNPNFKYKTVRVYEGFTLWGVLEGSLALRWTGKLENIKFDKGIVKLECIDNLKYFETINLATSTLAQLAVDIDGTQTTGISVTSTTGMAASGYILIDNEIIHYTSLSSTTLVTVTRGAFGTMRTSHSASAKITRVHLYYGNPFDIIEDIFITTGVPYDSVALAELSGNQAYTGEPDIACLIISDTKISDLYWELVEQMGCKSWIDEEGSITIRRNIFYGELPSLPTYLSSQVTLTDDLNFIKDSMSIDWDEKTRYTGITFYYDVNIRTAKRALSAAINNSVTTIPLTSVQDLPPKGDLVIGTEFISYVAVDAAAVTVTGATRGARNSTAASHSSGDAVYESDVNALKELKDAASFASVMITSDSNAETEFGGATYKTIYSRWFNTFSSYAPTSITISGYGTFLTALSTKMLASVVDAKCKLSFSLEIKDEALNIGDFHKVTTDEFNEVDGTSFTDKQFQVIKKDLAQSNIIKYVSEKVISYD